MQSKSQLREAARQRRKALAHPGFTAALAAHADALGLKPGTIVGGYHALPGEADPALLLEVLAGRGCHIVFPRVAANDRPLDYHRVPDAGVLMPGTFGIHEPLEHWPRAVPDVVLVPLLAFDATGHRLGYGGGFYDRTLERLEARAIGIAFAGQEISSLPHEPHDRRLDAVLTEQGFRPFR